MVLQLVCYEEVALCLIIMVIEERKVFYAILLSCFQHELSE